MKHIKGTSDPIRIFKYFSGIVTLVFTLFFLLPGLLRGENPISIRAYLLFSLTYGSVFIYLAVPGLIKKMKKWYLPPALILASIIPIAIINTKYHDLLKIGSPTDTSGDTMTVTILLLFPLIITSWSYSFNIVFLFYVVLGLLDPLFIILAEESFTPEIYRALNVSLLRITALGAIGFMITELRERQRNENEHLQQAHRQLEEYTRNNERLAVSRERNRIARELHDTLAHTLSGLAIQLGATETLIDTEDSQLRNMMEKAQKTVREGLNETRRALKSMRASPLEEFGLVEALMRLTDSARIRDNLDIETHFPESSPEWEPHIEECLYRIVQEGLENVIRHARASKVYVKLLGNKNRLDLAISDDGRGFSTNAEIMEGHFGLRGLKERALASGGILKITSGMGKGTSIHFHWEVSA